MCLEAFQSHPLDRQLDSTLVVDAVVFFIINVSGQAKVRHLHGVALIQPVGPKTQRFDFATGQVCRKLPFGSLLSFHSHLLSFRTHMQFLAARSRWTNFLLARYSIPLATCSPKPIRSFTVGFCEHKNPFYETHFSSQLLLPPLISTAGSRWWLHFNFCVKYGVNLHTCASSRMKLRRSPCFM